MNQNPIPPIGGTPIVTPKTLADFFRALKSGINVFLDELIRQLDPPPPPPPPPPPDRPDGGIIVDSDPNSTVGLG